MRRFVIHAHAEQLGIEELDVEVNVVRSNDAVVENSDQFARDVGKPRSIDHVGVRDPVNLCRRHAPHRIDERVEHKLDFAVRIHACDCDLDNAIRSGRQSGCLKIDDGDGCIANPPRGNASRHVNACMQGVATPTEYSNNNLQFIIREQTFIGDRGRPPLAG